MARSQSGVRGLFANAQNPADLLRFQYNPTGIVESKSVEWATAKIPGGDDELATFGSGASLRLTMQLFLNAYGEGADLPQPVSNPGVTTPREKRFYVESALTWLYRFTERQIDQSNGGQYSSSPGILLLVLGQLKFPGALEVVGRTAVPALPVRIESMNVNRIIFDKRDYVTLRATVDLSLVRTPGFGR